MSQVYPQTGSSDTPILVPGWSVQSANAGEDQGLTGHAGVSGGIVNPQTAPAKDTDTIATSVTVANAQNLQTTVNAVIDALKAAGVFK